MTATSGPGRTSLVVPAVWTTAFTIGAAATSTISLAIAAALFGTGAEYGYYRAASTLPNLLMLVLTAALTSTFVPVFSRYELREGHAAAWRMASRFLAAVVLAFGGLVLVLLVIAPWLIGGGILTHGPEFRPPARGYALTTLMLRIQLPNVVLSAVVGTLAGIHLSRRSYVRPAAAPLVHSLAMLATLVLLYRPLGVIALAIGSVVGPVAQVLLLAPVLRGGYRFTLDPRHPGVRRLALLLAPLVLSRLTVQGSDLVETRVASGIVGALAVVGIASTLNDRLTNIVSQGVALTTFPDLAHHAAADDAAGFRARFSLSTRYMLLAVLPTVVALLVLRDRLVALFLERGRFDAQDTVYVSMTFVGYLGAMAAMSVGKVASNALYARQRTRALAGIGVASTALYIPLVVALPRVTTPPYVGLSLAWSITSVGGLALALLALGRQSGGLDGRRIVVSGVRMAFAAVVMGAVLYSVDRVVAGSILAQPQPWRTVWLAVELAFLAGAGIAVYLAVLRWLGSTEAVGFVAALGRLRPASTRPGP